MVNGRITKSGKFDKRYNTQFREDVIFTFGIECEKCEIKYKAKSSSNYNFWSGVYSPLFEKWIKIEEADQPEYLQTMRKYDPDLADAWGNWDAAADDALLTVKQYYLKKGKLDKAKEIDDLIAKYKKK